VAEILAAIIDLRSLRPVIGVAAGPLGSFGGMSIGAGLCSRMLVTHEGRVGLDGPEVIESEAGVSEFDSSDRRLIWSVVGGAQRVASGLADALVLDDVPAVRQAVIAAVSAGVPARHRSEELDVLENRLRQNEPPSWRSLTSATGADFSLSGLGIAPAPTPGDGTLTASDLSSMQHKGVAS
jgi:malonate decarboxylase beta subunit